MTRCWRRCAGAWRRCGWAIRWTRTPTSPPSTRPLSWPRSASCPIPARPRARSGGRRRASCRSRASGSRPRCSPGCPRPIASPARRSSGRCCRCSPSGPRPRRSRRPTTPPTGCPPASGPTRVHGFCGWPRGCGPGGCGPTRSTNSTPPHRSAATRSPATAARAAATAWRHTSMSETVPAQRLAVRKTYKLFIGGAFPRSGSGRAHPVTDHKDNFLANAAMASRKDARDAVTAARKAVAGWSGATAYNRGQVLYRVAELLEGRRFQFTAEVRAAEGVGARAAEAAVDAAIDRWVWYAGWADKIAQVRGAANPVAGPYYNISLPEPTGVAAGLAPPDSSLLGFVSVVAPAVVSGNTVIAVTSEAGPLPAVTLSEVLATSDVPGGVINILTGRTAEIAPWLGSHMDVNAIDLTGAPDDLADDLAEAAADNLKRVIRPRSGGGDWTGSPSLHRMNGYLETKTVWHPTGT